MAAMILAALLTLLAASPALATTWTTTGSMAVARRDHTATLLSDGKVLIVGWFTKRAELYDPATGTFSATGDTISSHGQGSTATRLMDGKVLIVGGNGAATSAEIFDPVSGTFSATGSLNQPHDFHTATRLVDGRVLIAGGNGASGDSTDVAEIYDPVAGSFSITGSLNTPRVGSTATLLPDGRVLIVGGTQSVAGSGQCLNSAEIYDPVAGMFSLTTGSMVEGRCSLWWTEAPRLSNGKILIAGGLILDSAELFDPTTGMFSSTGNMTTPRAAPTATLLASGQVLIAGGATAGGPVTSNSAELYDPESGTFAATASMNGARQQHTATLLANGQVLVTGGFDGKTESASAELFTITPVSPAPTISRVAGTGAAGFSADGGAATSAQLNFPRGVAVRGSFYIADRHNHRVRRVDTVTGDITTVVGTGVAGFSGDGGPATSAQLNLPYDVTVDSAGNLYIADLNNHRIRMVAHGGDGVVDGGGSETITTVAGNGIIGGAGDGGAATAASLWNPKGVAVDGPGNVYIADEMNQRIRTVLPGADGVVNGGLGETMSTVAGNGLAGFSGDGGPAAAARLNGPNGVAVDGAGNVYVADTGNDRIRRVSAGSISTVAGGGAVLGDGGPATSAQLNRPTGLVVHPPTTGDLYIADFSNNRIRKVDAASGTISTVAGTGVACAPSTAPCGDGGPATAAQLSGPADVAIDPATGDLYIADLNDHRIRRVGAGE